MGEIDIYTLMEPLRRKYTPHLLSKLNEVVAILKILEADHNLPAELEWEVHKLVGSAGMYGFQEVSLRLKELESIVKKKHSLSDTEITSWIKQLQTLIKHIKTTLPH